MIRLNFADKKTCCSYFVFNLHLYLNATVMNSSLDLVSSENASSSASEEVSPGDMALQLSQYSEHNNRSRPVFFDFIPSAYCRSFHRPFVIH